MYFLTCSEDRIELLRLRFVHPCSKYWTLLNEIRYLVENYKSDSAMVFYFSEILLHRLEIQMEMEKVESLSLGNTQA